MKKLVSIVLFVWVFCSASFTQCCTFTLSMFDSFGDGWNGGSLTVNVAGTNFGPYSASGSGSQSTFTACPGDLITLTYSSGAWEGENTYSLLDPNGTVLFSDGPNPTTGTVFNTNAFCPPNCFDGIQNGNETGIDCGGSCPPCHCSDGIQNNGETGVDCGGPCPNSCPIPCNVSASYSILSGAGGACGNTVNYNQTITISNPNLGYSNDFIFTSVPTTALSAGTLTINAMGDLNSANEIWTILSELGATITTLGASGSQCSSVLTITIPLSIADLNAWAADGTIIFQGVDLSSSNVNPNLCGNEYMEMTLSYDGCTPELSCNGGTVQLTAIGQGQYSFALNNDFDLGFAGTGWNASPAATFTNPCDPSVDGGTYMWMGDMTAAPRNLETNPLDVSCGGEICFYLDFATQGNASPCEGPDLPSEGVYLQFSTDGGATWTTINYFDPTAGNYTSWAQYCFPIPPAAQTNNTIFSWWQGGSSGTIYDHWGIDNVTITSLVNCDPYTYDWSHIPGTNNDSTTVVNVTQTSTYTVTYTNGTDTCSTSITVTVPDGPIIAGNVITNETCPGDCDGSASSSVTNSAGTPPYSYLWSNNATTTNVNNLCPGDYIITVTDDNNCTHSDTVTINPGVVLTPTISPVAAQCLNSNLFSFNSANSTISSGSISSYNWDFGDGIGSSTSANPTYSYANAGSYVVTLTISDGNCTESTSINVTIWENPSASAIPSDETCFNTCDGAIDLTVIGSGGYTYSWNNGAGNQEDPNGLCPNTYDVLITDINGCQTTASAIINGPTLLSSSISGTDVSCNNSCDGSSTVNASGGSPGYTYLWNDPNAQTTATASNLCAGSYIVSVIDNNGCNSSANITINEPSILSASINSSDVSCNGLCDGSATVTANGGTPGYTYLWDDPNTQTTATASNLCAGVFTVTITDNNGCTQTSSVTINEPSILSASIVGSDVSCFNSCDGSSTVTASGGSPGYSYLWNDPNAQTTATATNLCAGTFNVTISDNNGCTQTLTTTINEPTLLTNSISSNDGSCNNSCDGTATVNTIGGTPGYSYQWNDPAFQTTATATNLCAGSYSVIVTDNNGCIQNSSITINEPSAINLTTSSINSNCGNNDGQVSVIASGGTAGYTYLWDDPNTSTSATVNNLIAGTYIVTVTDANGCTEIATATISDNGSGTASISINNNISCNSLCNGSASATIVGGAGPFTYFWNNGETTSTASTLCAGTISVDITDANGCVVTVSDLITEPNILSSAITSFDDVTCNSLCDAVATVNVSGGTLGYTYLWNDPSAQTTASANNLCAGNYTVDITDANGCTTSASVTINEPTAINTSIIGTDVLCNNACDGSADLTVSGGTPGYTYLWDDPNSTSSEDISGLCAGSYSVTITDANGCTGTENITINQPTALVLTPSSVNSNCGNSDGQVSVQVNGGTPNYSYLWNDPSASTTSAVNNLLAGNYSVIVTDNNGCNQNTSITISDNSPASIFHTQVDILCNGGNNGAIDVTLNGGNSPFTYNWIGPSGFTSNAQDLTGLTAGTYDLTCIDAVNCIVNLSVTISEPSPIILSTNGINATCFLGNDGEVSVSASGGMPGFSYNWYNNLTLTTNVGIGTNITNLTAGTYYVTVTDANGCTVNDNITISEPNEIIVTTSSIDATCGQSNGLISVSGTSGGSGIYVSEIWQDANGNSITNTTSVSAGSYYVTVTDDNGCTGNGIANVSDLSGPIGQIDGYGDASCYGSCDGFANIVVGGGTPNYTYVWQPQPGSGQGTTSATNLCAGIYTIDITDANGCATSVIVNINEPAQLSLTLASSSDASGSGICDGQATISTSGGSPNYSYFWFDDCNLTLPNTSINGTSVNNLCAGTYGVLVTDNNNCPDTLCITINEPNPIIISVTGNDVLCKNDCNGSATASVIGGVAPFNYQWYSAATNQSINQNSITASNLCSGTYYVVVTDANGVSMTSSNFTVNEPPILAANTSVISNYNGQDISCFGACDGAVEVIPIGGTSPYTYQWSVNANSQNTPIAINLCAGTYDVTVTDANGCISNVNISLTQPIDLTNSNTSSDVSCNGFCDGTISSNPLGGTTPYSYLWNNSNFSTTSSISNLCPGTYSVTITDANGCSTIETSTITEPNQLVISATSTGSNCNQNDGSATVSIVSGTPPYIFQWDNNAGAQTTATATNLFSGCYDVIINEGNGCIDTVNVCVTDLGAPTVSILTQSDVSCYNSCDGFAQIQVFGGAPPVQYNWYDQNNQPINQTTASAFNLCAGTYIGEMTDSNGCQASVNVIINEPLELNGIISANSSVTCFGDCDGTVTVTASSGTAPYNYQWNDPNFQTTANASNLCPGNYSVTITDNNNCSLTIPTTIGEPDQIQLTVNSTDAYCNTNSGSANVILNNGGVNPISYLWTPSGQTTSSATNLNPGNYAITVTDANGCTANSSTTVGNIPPGTASISNLTNTLCPGSCDGTATVSMSGTATAPFIYEWFTNSGLSIGQDSITAINLCAGYYYCVVTDANGCISFTNQFDISEPAPLSLIVDTDSSNCYASCNGQAVATVSGGTGSYQYQWDDPLLQITPTAFNLCAGTYTILATDNNGCTISSQVNIEQPNAIILDSTVINANCGLSNGEGCVTVIGGIAPYNYLWPNNATTSCLNGLAAGSYLVEVTDANNCSQNIVVEISDIDGPIASIISVTNTSCYGSCDGSATVDMIGGSGTFFTVQWDSSAFNQTTP
ncbi:MAG: hypothetical protein CMD01_02070, partial [Flavobacteriales bacterium]|nr:hypothetical protein [Flavobacteriales bacterium]